MVRESLVAEGISNERVLKAMRATPRHEFIPDDLPAEYKGLAYADMALPIGEGQTISPPYIVAFMTEKLDPDRNDRVLEIGTGSGYQAAVLSPLVKEVYTIEIVEPLGKQAAKTLKRLRYNNVYAKVGDGYQGWPEKAPFDKIIVTCSPEKIPQPLIDQLAEGGRMVIPLGERYQQTMYLYRKKDGKLQAEALAPTLFVPMTGRAESGREVQPDPLKPALVNSSFEETHESGERPTGWHYQRQLKLKVTADAPEGKRYVSFYNATPSRDAHALQAFAVDGRKVKKFKVGCYVKTSNVRAGATPLEVAGIYITFFDERRAIPTEGGIADAGKWRGTQDWKETSTEIDVPESAREAILRIGLHGATGEAAFDNVTVEAVKE
jgi:protein-L-isoaspartate(D-aspartate) O-methyltransferase